MNNMRLLIGSIAYQVEQREGLRGENQEKLNGWIQYNNTLILLEQEMDDQVKAVTLLHEILHGVFESCGRATDDQEQESEIDALAHGLFGVIRQNPDLMEWIMGIV